jgi:hypothetical protein
MSSAKADKRLGAAPLPDKSKEEHRKHVEKFLQMEEYKTPPPGYEDKTDVAKP